METISAASTRRPAQRTGRPFRGQAASVTFGVRLTDSEYEEIATVAASLDVTITSLMRTSSLITARTAPALLTQEAIAVYRAGQGVSAAARAATQLLRDLRTTRRNEDLRFVVETLVVEVAACRDAYLLLIEAHARRAAMARTTLLEGRS